MRTFALPLEPVKTRPCRERGKLSLVGVEHMEDDDLVPAETHLQDDDEDERHVDQQVAYEHDNAATFHQPRQLMERRRDGRLFRGHKAP